MKKKLIKISELFDELEKNIPESFYKHESFMRMNKKKRAYFVIDITYRRKRQELPKK